MASLLGKGVCLWSQTTRNRLVYKMFERKVRGIGSLWPMEATHLGLQYAGICEEG